jgi:putative CocE/NonD family hydrolase
MIFDTGKRAWRRFDAWPPTEATLGELFLNPSGNLSHTATHSTELPFTEFVSDPANPVPYRDRQDIRLRFTPRPYMTDCQRFATTRQDVLVFSTDVLTEPVTVAGDLVAELWVSTDQSDADWIVKLIDVYPDNHPQLEGTPANITLANYHQMVRGDVIRGRFRDSFAKPAPFAPNQITQVNVPLQDVLHTFKPGHRIMVQVQSSWFPLIDLNPQKYVDNIFKAEAEDFTAAKHRVYHSPDAHSRIRLRLLQQP